MPKQPISKSGVSLVELLVVMGIIAILAAILLPAISSGNKAARIAQAQAEANGIAQAIQAFYGTYAKLPVADVDHIPSEDWRDAADSKDLIKVLTGDNLTLNPKDITFYPNQGGNIDGTFLDPWGIQYKMKLDLDLDGEVEYYGDRKTVGVVISYGPNTNQNNPASTDFDDIISGKGQE